MPMRATTVRFSDDLWGLLEQEAASSGVSAAQFVRDATVLRLAYLMGRRGDPGLDTTLERLGAGAPPSSAAAPVSQDVIEAVRDPDRLRALRATGLLDSPIQENFDRHARIAAEALNAPVALVSLVDEDRQFFKSCLGLPEPWLSQRGSKLSHSFCQHVVAAREPLLVDDSREHPVLKDNLAIRDMNVIAYAGMPLVDSDGQVLGTLCAIDHRPRQWSRRQVELLKDLAAGVTREIELARAAAERPATAGG
ncbi:MAG TPA: GAF domain-containing protein [Thermoleophilaceae bacterium]|jgi:GAF domain-containing protein